LERADDLSHLQSTDLRRFRNSATESLGRFLHSFTLISFHFTSATVGERGARGDDIFRFYFFPLAARGASLDSGTEKMV
jgi:hypothetical protein